MITKIVIENVKGYGIPGKEINLVLDSTKVNLCVAPNGFGKSSLATAFESLNQNRLNVEEDNKNVQHINEESSLTVTIDGHNYTANNRKNELNAQLKPWIIHNRTRVDYTKRHFKRVLSVNAFMVIEPIIVCNAAKPLKSTYYSIQSIKNTFGTNRKVLSAIDLLLNNIEFCGRLCDVFDDLQKFTAKKRYACVEETINAINSLKGNEDQVIASITDDIFNNLYEIDEYM